MALNIKSIMEIIVFKAGTFEMGIDIVDVREIIKSYSIIPVAHSLDYVMGVLNLRGKIVTVIDLKKKLSFESSDFLENRSGIMIVDIVDEIVGLYVEQVKDVIKFEKSKFELLPSNFSKELASSFIGVYKSQSGIISLLNKNSVAGVENNGRL